MHISGKVAAALCAIALTAVGSASSAYAAPGDQEPNQRAEADCTAPAALTFLNFNDFHGRVSAKNPDTTQFFGTIEELRAQAGAENTVLGVGGDSIGGTLFASAVQDDQPTIDVYNAAGVDASAVGNHEFDRGFDDLKERVIPSAEFGYLGANVYRKGTSTPALDEYKIVEKAGLRVGVIGAVTEDTPNVVVRDGIADLDFGDPVEAINRVADTLTDGDDGNGEADVLVVQIHEGGPDAAGSLEENMAAREPFANLVENTSPKVQAIFTGHTHKPYVFDAPVPGSDRTRPVTQSGNYAELVGKTELKVDPKTGATCSYSAENVELTDTPVDELAATYPRVAAVQNVVDQALAQAEEVGKKPIGEATGAFARPGAYNEDEGRFIDDRSGESTITNTIANMFRDQLSERTGENVIGIQNPGGTRADLCAPSDDQGNPCADEAFTITYSQAASVLPFANTLQTATLTGAQFKIMLEQQWSTDEQGQPTGSFLRLGLSEGVTYTYDEERDLGDRITSITIDGVPIDPKADYVVGSGNFLLAGGDNFRVFTETEPTDTGLVDLDTWIDWIEKNSPLDPSYAKRGLAVTPTPQTLTAGESVDIAVDQLDFTGGYPVTNSELVATLGAPSDPAAAAKPIELGRAAVSGGSVASLRLNVPVDAPAGDQLLVLTAPDSDTQVIIPVTVEGSAQSPSPEPSDPQPSASAPAAGEPTAGEPTAGEPSSSSTGDAPATGSGPNGSGSGGRRLPPLADTGGASALVGLLAVAALGAGGYLALRRRN